jgi:predicted acyltransferase
MSTTSSQRFLALDVFRGMTICFMIIVNTPGSGQFSYSPLEHARWHGFTPTDLVFPSFLFAVGNAMSFVMPKWASLPQSQVLGKIFKRTIIIFLCGYLLYWFPFVDLDKSNHLFLSPISHTRIFGVLQRIAIVYCIASLMIYYLKPKTSLIIAAIILSLYWIILLLGNAADPYSMTGNFGYTIDKLILGENHMYHGEGVAFEPEGLLGTLPAVGNTIGGYIVGQFLQQKGKTYEGISKLMLAGFACLTTAYLWDLVFPINKKLWTSPFVLYTVGLDCIIIAAIIYVVDFLGKTKWTNFFTVFGKNPLFIYLVSEVGVIILYIIHANPKQPLYNWLYENIYKHAGLYFGSLLFAISWMLFCWLVGYILDKKKIYVRV